MPKVTYILGAGASAGAKDANGNRQRGVPTICEFAQECQSCIDWIETQNGISLDSREEVLKELKWLYGICENYPTVDTYARLLYSTGRNGEYHRLKNILSVFLTICQIRYPHDQRYDGWIASLVDDMGFLPESMNVLSWNYDAQFEMAYSGYFKEHSLKTLWSLINVLNKSFLYEPKNNDKFSFVKLNGTAFNHLDDDNHYIFDTLVYPDNEIALDVVFESVLKPASNVINELSYVWENRLFPEIFKKGIIDKVKDTEIVVVIGYSFPYVNRSMDKMIFANMPKLKKVYVQDLNADNVVEMVRGRLDENANVEIVSKKNLSQFYIPNELE